MKTSRARYASPWLIACICTLPLSCGTLPTAFQHVTHPVRLAESKVSEGHVERYLLETNHRADEVVVVVETRRLEQRANLGLEVQEINRAFAKERNLRPFSGVWITKVASGGPAAGAGLHPGDVIVSIAGIEVFDLDGCEHALQRVEPGQLAQLHVLEHAAGEPIEISLVADGKRNEIVERRAVTLDAAGLDEDHSGLALATVPPSLSQQLYGIEQPCVVVAATALASPAELSGVEPGDRLLAIDGHNVADATQARRMIAFRAKERDEVELTLERLASGSVGTLTLTLDAYEDENEVKIPLIFSLEDGHATTDWSIGPFGWLMDYESQYVYQGGVPEGRERYRKRKKFAMLLDLFRHEWFPDDRGGSETRLLWFIKFSF